MDDKDKGIENWLIRVVKDSAFCLKRTYIEPGLGVCTHPERKDDKPRECTKNLCPRFWADLP